MRKAYWVCGARISNIAASLNVKHIPVERDVKASPSAAAKACMNKNMAMTKLRSRVRRMRPMSDTKTNLFMFAGALVNAYSSPVILANYSRDERVSYVEARQYTHNLRRRNEHICASLTPDIDRRRLKAGPRAGSARAHLQSVQYIVAWGGMVHTL